MEIRKATIEDLKDIQSLNKMLFDEEFDKYDKTINCDWPFSEGGEDFYKERIEKDSGCAFVLIKDGEMIGYLVASLSEDEFYRNVDNFAELDDMYIVEGCRGGGGGKLLYDKFVQWAKSKGVERVKILVTAKNKRGIDFYKKMGYEDYNVTLEGKI